MLLRPISEEEYSESTRPLTYSPILKQEFEPIQYGIGQGLYHGFFLKVQMTDLEIELSSCAANAFAGTNHKCDTSRCIISMHPEPLYRTAKANMSPVQMRRVQTYCT